jgi:inhibitor of cysteine peptidase
MKAKLIIVCLMTILFLSLAACSSGGPQEQSANDASSGKEISLANGGTLTVTLQSNVTTGYSWDQNAKISDATVLQQTDHKYVTPTSSASPVIGAGGNEIWAFKALKAVKSTISMQYSRPFEPNATPAKTFTLTVTIQ